MRALVTEAEWAPRPGYAISEKEIADKIAFSGSEVWCNPRFDVRRVPSPQLRDTEVLIRPRVCGICGTDTHLYETDEEGYIIFSGLTKFPCILGHEFSGIVEEVGGKVVDLRVGDIVAAESVMWCGMCQPCRSGAPNQCDHINLMGLSVDGAFAEFVCVDARYCWKIDSLLESFSEQLAIDLAALIEPIGCSYNGMFVAAGGLTPGSTVAVYGLGPIGLAAIALARTAGASQILGFDVIDERVCLAKELGADAAFNLKSMAETTSSDIVMELTHGAGAEMLVEAAGAATQTLPEMLRAMSAQGKIVYLGRAAQKAEIGLNSLISKAGRIVGSRGHAGYGIFPSVIRLLASKRLDVGKMITSRYDFNNVLNAIEKSTDRRDGKILVRVCE